MLGEGRRVDAFLHGLSSPGVGMIQTAGCGNGQAFLLRRAIWRVASEARPLERVVAGAERGACLGRERVCAETFGGRDNDNGTEGAGVGVGADGR